LSLGSYRITESTMALFSEDGRHVTLTVPIGAFVTMESATFDGSVLVDVIWDGKKLMMFTHDLRLRAERIAEEGGVSWGAT